MNLVQVKKIFCQNFSPFFQDLKKIEGGVIFTPPLGKRRVNIRIQHMLTYQQKYQHDCQYHYIGPILDDRLKEKILKPWKGALSSHSVCVSVCERATGHTFWHGNLIFGLSDPWDMRKKHIFLFFEIFIFTLFIGIFRFFPYITLVIFLVSSSWSQFFI